MTRAPLPFSDYGSTRFDVDLQRRINLYPHSDGGFRQYPGLVEFADMDATYDSVSFDPTNEMTFPSLLTLSSDGTKMYVYDSVVDTAYQYTLSTAWDLSTAAYASKNFDASTLIATGAGFQIANSDSKLYIMDSTDATIHQYSITAGDISTAVSDAKNKDISAELGALATGFFIANSGTRLYAHEGGNGRDLYSYTLSTPYDISTASYDSKTIDTVTTFVLQIWFSEVAHGQYAAGEVMYLMTSGGAVREFELSTAYDITTATRMIQWNDSIGSSWGGSFMRPSGVRWFVLDRFDDLVYQFTMNLTMHFRPAVGTTGSNVEGRGAMNMGGVLYLIQNRNLISVDSAGQGTLIGDVLDNGGATASYVNMENDGTQLVLCTGATIYKYTVAGGLVENTDVDLTETANTSAYLDQRFMYDQPAGQFVASEIDDALNVAALDFATAESFNDDLVAVYGHNQLLYLLGETSIEAWYTSGTGRPPLDRQQVIERGLLTAFSITSIDNTIYFIDQTRRPNRMSGLEYAPIYNSALSKEWDTYATVDDARVLSYTFQNENFIEFAFPTQDVSWTYHELSQTWNKREDTSNARFRSIAYVEVYGKNILLDRSNAKLYTLSPTTYQDDSSAITRTLDTAPLTSEIVGVVDRDISLDDVTITVYASTTAVLSVSFSKDSGANFGAVKTHNLIAGTQRVLTGGYGEFMEGILRITTTSNARVDILRITGDVVALNG